MAQKFVLTSLFLVHVEKEILFTSICLHDSFCFDWKIDVLSSLMGWFVCVVVYVNVVS